MRAVILPAALLAVIVSQGFTPDDPALIASRLALVRKAAEQTDPLPELVQLCDGIGPRLTGSTPALQAERQVLSHMRTIGLQKVHAEAWTLPHSWERGPASASLATPFALTMPIAAYGWTGSTPKHSGPVPVVLVSADDVAEHLDALVRSQGENWRGKALLISEAAAKPMQSYAGLLPLVQAATAAHAVAILRSDTRPGNGLVHSEPVAVNLLKTSDTKLIAAVDLPAEHQKLIERLLVRKTPVSVNIEVKNRFSAGPVLSSNLVGEIAGAVFPDEVVLVGAHLDSWDLGTGAIDDGFGSAAILGAAQALVRSAFAPRAQSALFSSRERKKACLVRERMFSNTQLKQAI